MNNNEIEMISCETALSLIHDAQGPRPELSEEEEVRMRAHLDGCEECRREYERLCEITALIASSAYEAPVTLRDSVIGEIRRNRSAAANRRRFVRYFGSIAAAFAVVVGIFSAVRLGGFDKAAEMEANMAADADHVYFSFTDEMAMDTAADGGDYLTSSGEKMYAASPAYNDEDGVVPEDAAEAEAEAEAPEMKMTAQSAENGAMGMRDDSVDAAPPMEEVVVEEPAVEEIVVEEPVVEEAPVMDAPAEEAEPHREKDSMLTSVYTSYAKTGEAVISTAAKHIDKTPFTKKYMPKGEFLTLIEYICGKDAIAEFDPAAERTADAPLLWHAVQEMNISRTSLKSANSAFANDPGVYLTDSQMDALFDRDPAAAREAFANTWALCVRGEVYTWEMLCGMSAEQMKDAGITASRLRIYTERMADVFMMLCGSTDTYRFEFERQVADLTDLAAELGETYTAS